MSDESVRAMSQHARWETIKKTQYDGLSDDDRRLNVEGQLTAVLSTYGGKRLVAGKVMHDLVQDLTSLIYKMKEEGLI